MGINLQDINILIHYGAPQSLEDYFQQAGVVKLLFPQFTGNLWTVQ